MFHIISFYFISCLKLFLRHLEIYFDEMRIIVQLMFVLNNVLANFCI